MSDSRPSALRGKSSPRPYVALLRGINVGGKNKLPMKDLCAMFTSAGCTDVRNYIQSGNIVFQAERALAAKLPALITRAIAERCGLQVPVVLRSAEEMRAIPVQNPVLGSGERPEELAVCFLADLPDPARVAALDPHRSPPDAFVVHGREIYLRCPNGFAGTKLTTGYFDSKLATISTFRNWRTVLTLIEMLDG
jgi:uncharacterized protein (DUF1697 family)